MLRATRGKMKLIDDLGWLLLIAICLLLIPFALIYRGAKLIDSKKKMGKV